MTAKIDPAAAGAAATVAVRLSADLLAVLDAWVAEARDREPWRPVSRSDALRAVVAAYRERTANSGVQSQRNASSPVAPAPVRPSGALEAPAAVSPPPAARTGSGGARIEPRAVLERFRRAMAAEGLPAESHNRRFSYSAAGRAVGISASQIKRYVEGTTKIPLALDAARDLAAWLDAQHAPP